MLNAQERVEFGNYLRGLRKRAGKTLRQVNEETGISHSYLGLVEKAERNPPQPEFLRKLAALYGVPQTELMQRAGHLGKPVATAMAEDEAEVRHAYEYVINHPRYRTGHSLDAEPSIEVMRFVVGMFERLTGQRLLSETPGEATSEGE